ncbi:hypothetical protein JKP88DRAFT_298095 [Tribonema minus]|uniref:C2 domain-containing protein n=1 Tax=Tribonema minus TaxID=303371 RepID=A0A835ZEG7_9STRA|nr:hypothetical protein JKP88DRAFT_298095 [Tribonema minus]
MPKHMAISSQPCYETLYETLLEPGHVCTDVHDFMALHLPGAVRAQSLAAVRRIAAVASGFAMELLLGAAAATEEQVRAGLGVMATHCYARSIDELGKHMATKNQGMSPLSAESLLDLLSFLLRRDDCLTSPPPATTSSAASTSTQHQPAGLEAVLVAMHWRVTPSPLLSSFLPPRAVAEAYAIKAEDKLRAFFENIVANSSRPLPAEVGFDVEVWEYLDRGDNPKVMSVVAATAMQLLCEGHMAIIQKRFPTHSEVQGALLRAAAGALATLRNAVAARAHSVFEALLLTAADNHGTNAVVRHHLSVFLCAMANDARWLVQESLPDLEEGCELGAQAEDGRAAQALSVVTQVWLDLCAECTQRLARLVLVTLEQQVNFNEALGSCKLRKVTGPSQNQGLCHEDGSTQLVHARRVLKEQFGGLRDLLDEWCYNRLLARIADHIVVRIVEDLVHRAVVGERLQDGDILRLKEVQTAAARTLQDIAGEGAGSDLYEQRMEFLDEAVRLLSATPDELEALTRNLVAHHSSCQLSIQHMLEIIVQLRPDGHTDAIPEEVIKWADPDNHMGVDSEGDNQGSGLRDYSELSPHSRLFRQPLAALRAMHTEMGVMLQAATAMADPRTGQRVMPKAATAVFDPQTGQRVMPKAQEKPQETSLMRRFTLTGKSNIPSKLESPPPSTRRRKAPKSPPHVLSIEGPGATSVELHIRVTEADGLAMTATVGRSKAAAGSGNPVWDEVLIFKMRSLVGTLLELTIITESRSKGETTIGGLKIPLSGCAVLKELSVDTFLKGDERRRLSTSGRGSGNDDEGDSGDIKGSWFPLDPPGAGRATRMAVLVAVFSLFHAYSAPLNRDDMADGGLDLTEGLAALLTEAQIPVTTPEIPSLTDPRNLAVKTLQPFYKNSDVQLPELTVGAYQNPVNKDWWFAGHAGLITAIPNKRDATPGDITTVLDITDIVTFEGGEVGFNGLAFSPDFATTGFFYTDYVSTAASGKKFTHISRFTYKPRKPGATRKSEKTILRFEQPGDIHMAGQILFEPKDIAKPKGKKGYHMYMPKGDGGGVPPGETNGYNDKFNKAQTITSPLGKVNRIFIKRDGTYTIPKDNLKDKNGKPVLAWASFDKSTLAPLQMWCGDVGEESREEVNRVKPRGNHGWRVFEGTKFTGNDPNKSDMKYVKPTFEFCHDTDKSDACKGKPFTGDAVIGGLLKLQVTCTLFLCSLFVPPSPVTAQNLTTRLTTLHRVAANERAEFEDRRLARLHRQKSGAWKASTILRWTSDAGLAVALGQDLKGELYIVTAYPSNFYRLTDQ